MTVNYSKTKHISPFEPVKCLVFILDLRESKTVNRNYHIMLSHRNCHKRTHATNALGGFAELYIEYYKFLCIIRKQKIKQKQSLRNIKDVPIE